ncbi:helix-turn-helix domain-containing protein [Pedobacter sp. AW1-32]|uniref:helix-turn-helix domain-containing protein n=1 Tax=Pedobacter sp. AW1-32 TaxID=3383026 RepID=UPI003FF0DC1C
MEIINQQNLSACIRDSVRTELHEHFTKNIDVQISERLLSKTDLAEELGISLVTLNLWMRKGLPFLRLHKRIYFKRSEVVNAMHQEIKL